MAPPHRYPNHEQRQAAVRKAMEQHSKVSMQQREALAVAFSCTVPTITSDIRTLTSQQAPKPKDKPILRVHARHQLADQRDTAVLRALGRIQRLTTEHIQALFFRDTSHITMSRHLRRLLDQDLIWRTTTTTTTIDPSPVGSRILPPPKAPYVYGLTHEGKQLLQTLEVEPHLDSFERFKSRDRRAPLPPQTQLNHDLMASDWCCSMLDALRRCSLLVDIRCQVEYVAATDDKNKELQRFDAYFAVRFTKKPRPQTLPGWWLPWYDGTGDGDDDITVRFALEVDRGVEKSVALIAKSVLYRDFTRNGHYKDTLGGSVLPVILASKGVRSAQIARDWQAAWPKGLGVISTPELSSDSPYGAVWGEYLTMTDIPAKPYKLLGKILPSIDTWTSYSRLWVPGTPR